MILGAAPSFDGQTTPASAPLRRVIGTSWIFRYTWYAPDGVTPLDLTGKIFTCDLIPHGGFDPLASVGVTNDANTNLALGRFAFVFPPNTVQRPLGNIANAAQDVCRIYVHYADDVGNVYPVVVQYVQAVIP